MFPFPCNFAVETLVHSNMYQFSASVSLSLVRYVSERSLGL